MTGVLPRRRLWSFAPVFTYLSREQLKAVNGHASRVGRTEVFYSKLRDVQVEMLSKERFPAASLKLSRNLWRQRSTACRVNFEGTTTMQRNKTEVEYPSFL